MFHRDGVIDLSALTHPDRAPSHPSESEIDEWQVEGLPHKLARKGHQSHDARPMTALHGLRGCCPP